jgi:hypothetical protein
MSRGLVPKVSRPKFRKHLPSFSRVSFRIRRQNFWMRSARGRKLAVWQSHRRDRQSICTRVAVLCEGTARKGKQKLLQPCGGLKHDSCALLGCHSFRDKLLIILFCRILFSECHKTVGYSRIAVKTLVSLLMRNFALETHVYVKEMNDLGVQGCGTVCCGRKVAKSFFSPIVSVLVCYVRDNRAITAFGCKRTQATWRVL